MSYKSPASSTIEWGDEHARAGAIDSPSEPAANSFSLVIGPEPFIRIAVTIALLGLPLLGRNVTKRDGQSGRSSDSATLIDAYWRRRGEYATIAKRRLARAKAGFRKVKIAPEKWVCDERVGVAG